MDKSKLSVLFGLKVVDVVLADGDIGIGFENGISLSIYNKYELEGFVLSDALRLVGNTVTYVDEQKEVITIRFENNWVLRVDMRDEAYSGPEAMQLRVPDDPIVVWN